MTKTTISQAFKSCKKEKRPALLTFTVAGDNSKKNSLKILNSIAKYADILELSFLHNCQILTQLVEQPPVVGLTIMAIYQRNVLLKFL